MTYFWIFIGILVLWFARRYLSFKVTRHTGNTDVVIPAARPVDNSFHTKVVGVSHSNSDGTKRQAIIKRHCSLGQRLELVPEPTNPKDPNALGVWVSGHQIGYITSGRTAEDLGRIIKRGEPLRVSVSGLTGGSRDKPTVGVNILVDMS